MRRGVPEWSHVRLRTTPSSCRSASQQQHFCGDVWSAECHNSTENTSVEELNIWPQYSPKRKELNWHHLGVRPPCLPLVAAGHWVVFGLPLRMECCYTERRWEEETRGVIRQTMQDLHCTFMVEGDRERERERERRASTCLATSQANPEQRAFMFPPQTTLSSWCHAWRQRWNLEQQQQQ